MACRGESQRAHPLIPKEPNCELGKQGDKSSQDPRWTWRRCGLKERVILAVLATSAVYGASVSLFHSPTTKQPRVQRVSSSAADILNQCASRHVVPETPLLRHISDRFEAGTRPTLIKNVTLWTGARNGTEIVYGDVFLDKGLVQGIGYIPEAFYVGRDTDVHDAHGGWITPGLGK